MEIGEFHHNLRKMRKCHPFATYGVLEKCVFPWFSVFCIKKYLKLYWFYKGKWHVGGRTMENDENHEISRKSWFSMKIQKRSPEDFDRTGTLVWSLPRWRRIENLTFSTCYNQKNNNYHNKISFIININN